VSILSSFLSILRLATKRLWAHKGLALSLLIGWTAAVGLGLSLPLYADAVNHLLLREELETIGEGAPPFAFRFRYIGSWNGALDWEEVQQADTYLRMPVAADIGLPLERAVRHFKTDNFRLFPASEAAYADTRDPLEWVQVGFVSELADHITILEGAFPTPRSPNDTATEVLIHFKLAEDLGLQVAEEYVLFGHKEAGVPDSPSVQIPVRISGIWQPVNVEDDYWFYPPEVFDRVLLVPEASFHRQIASVLKGEVNLGLWYLVFDGENVYTEDVLPLLGRIALSRTRAASLLPHVRLDVSPAEAMQKYRSETYLLTILLSVFAIPVLGLILYFVALTARMAVRRQQTEIAVLRSRGTSRWQVLGVYLLEGLALGAAALGLGILLGQGVALAMGQVRSFLTLVDRPLLPVRLSWFSLRYALAAVALALLATLFPALSATRHTIVTHKQEQARALRRPFWQRYFLDLLLLAPALYGYYLLKQRGTISVNLGGGVTADPFQNPLLFLVPTLFIFALGLLSIRLFPLLMSALAWLFGLLPGTSSVLALRHLARSSGQYTAPLLLLILTLGLAAFIASMALTLDSHLVDQVYYQIGADVQLDEIGESTRPSIVPFAAQEEEQAEEDNEAGGPKWFFLPVHQHLDVAGVRAVARVGKYAARSTVDVSVNGTLVGVDRVDFQKVAFFRRDFASAPLGGLMNLLASDTRALLVERNFLARNMLSLGDSLRLELMVEGEQRTVPFIIAGALDLFPTLYPEDGPFFVANLDYVFQLMGNEFLYDVWLATDKQRSTEAIVNDLTGVGYTILDYRDAPEIILTQQTRPSRQGLFGVLSVGFIGAAGLTVLGFLLYAIFSFRQRFIQLGVLRAIGLSVGQMIAFLAGELIALIAMGGVIGTALGVWTSYLFIPFLQVESGPHPRTPPFVVQVAWSDIDRIVALFGAMLLVGVVTMTILLVRMRVFEAVKLGEVA